LQARVVGAGTVPCPVRCFGQAMQVRTGRFPRGSWSSTMLVGLERWGLRQRDGGRLVIPRWVELVGWGRSAELAAPSCGGRLSSQAMA
jgi:hypothetical protein